MYFCLFVCFSLDEDTVCLNAFMHQEDKQKSLALTLTEDKQLKMYLLDPWSLPARMSAPTMAPTPNKHTATATKWTTRYRVFRKNQESNISTGITKQSSSWNTHSDIQGLTWGGGQKTCCTSCKPACSSQTDLFSISTYQVMSLIC